MNTYTRITIGTIFAVALVIFVGVGIGIVTHDTQAREPAITQLTDAQKGEILWLARILYSETKRPEEQVLVGWVVRNRVETNYMGSSYREVALKYGQFSGLHAFDRNYNHNVSRTYASGGEVWKRTLAIAEAIYTAPDVLRPFPKTVRHFISPHALSVVPKWARDREPVHTITDTKTKRVRFAFYDNI